MTTMLTTLLALTALNLFAADPSVPTLQEINPTRMRQESEASTVEMRGSLKRLIGMIEKARAARDVVLLNCLNEKLTQMKALVRVGEQSNTSLQEFIAKDQIEGATHERRKVGLAAEKVKAIGSESEACVGESGAAGGGKTIVTVDAPELPGDPTHLDDPLDVDDMETPPSASPYN